MAEQPMRKISQAFNIGSRGVVVKNLQKCLGVTPDGIYGNRTARELADLQRNYGLPPTGRADAATFTHAGLPWPDEFERCMNLVHCFEGTGFGDCNATDIDGAGLTLGIAGFTTAHGEVQQLLAGYLATNAPAIEQTIGTKEHERLQILLRNGAAPAEWKRFFFDTNGRVREVWQRAFLTWGRDPAMQRLQLDLARQRFWARAMSDTKRLRLTSDRARCLLLDIAVQNGGWKTKHDRLVQHLREWNSDHEPARLMCMAHAVAQGAVARWRNDVLQRKLTIARGTGTVHGRSYRLTDYAIEPAEETESVNGR